MKNIEIFDKQVAVIFAKQSNEWGSAYYTFKNPQKKVGETLLTLK